MAIILKANKVDLFVSCFVCFLVPFTEPFRHTNITYQIHRNTAAPDRPQLAQKLGSHAAQ
jgi:hypothetical protein